LKPLLAIAFRMDVLTIVFIVDQYICVGGNSL